MTPVQDNPCSSQPYARGQVFSRNDVAGHVYLGDLDSYPRGSDGLEQSMSNGDYLLLRNAPTCCGSKH